MDEWATLGVMSLGPGASRGQMRTRRWIPLDLSRIFSVQCQNHHLCSQQSMLECLHSVVKASRLRKFEYIKCSYLEPHWSHHPVFHLNIRQSVKAGAHLKQKLNLNFKSSNNLLEDSNIKGNFEKWAFCTKFKRTLPVINKNRYVQISQYLGHRSEK